MMHVSKNKCVGCGLCVDVCTQEAIVVSKGIAQIDKDKCVECQACLQECPQEAIRFIENINLVVAFGTDDGNTQEAIRTATENISEIIEEKNKKDKKGIILH